MTLLRPLSLSVDLWTGATGSSGTFRLLLLTDSYQADMASHSRRSHLTGELPTANGYTQGGATVTITSATDAATLRHTLTLGGVTGTWTSSSLSARYAAWVHWTGGASSADPLLAVLDLGRMVNGPLNIPSQSLVFSP